MTEKEKMINGLLYSPMDEDLRSEFLKVRELTEEYNLTKISEIDKRTKIIRELFGKTGENVYIEPNFRCDYGFNISVGENFYANYDCIILDICPVNIGDNVLLAPRVGIYTAAHPIYAPVRNMALEYGRPITIGNNVWIGANAIINPGVTIGDDVVIGSGAVVTKDIPGGVVAVGNPCRVLRKINGDDKEFWSKLLEEYERGEQNEAICR